MSASTAGISGAQLRLAEAAAVRDTIALFEAIQLAYRVFGAISLRGRLGLSWLLPV